MKKIAIVGAGTMGNGIAHSFAQSGFNVVLIDLSPEKLQKGLDTIHSNLDRQIKKGSLTEQQKEEILIRVSIQTHFNNLKEVYLAIEAVYENFEVKSDVLKELADKVGDDTILASNTSSISITKLAASLPKPEQFIGMHFMNPVPVMALVEIINGYNTSKATTESISEITKALGKTPIIVNDYPGFVANRILIPMINEAIITLYEGVAGVQEIDSIMKLGMAHPMGPLQLADFIGLDVCLNILNVLHQGLGNPKYFPSPLLINMVQAGKLGAKSGEGFYNWSKGSKDLTISPRFQT